MRGTPEDVGLIPLAVNEIFALIEACQDREFLLRVSYMEVGRVCAVRAQVWTSRNHDPGAYAGHAFLGLPGTGPSSPKRRVEGSELMGTTPTMCLTSSVGRRCACRSKQVRHERMLCVRPTSLRSLWDITHVMCSEATPLTPPGTLTTAAAVQRGSA